MVLTYFSLLDVANCRSLGDWDLVLIRYVTSTVLLRLSLLTGG